MLPADPITVTLPKGVYSWCSCPYSQTQPFCDGKHIGKGYCPVVLKLKTEQSVTLCGCKYSQNRPYCDGTHARLTPKG
jgi:CDGSH-type Zn-finger protein